MSENKAIRDNIVPLNRTLLLLFLLMALLAYMYFAVRYGDVVIDYFNAYAKGSADSRNFRIIGGFVEIISIAVAFVGIVPIVIFLLRSASPKIIRYLLIFVSILSSACAYVLIKYGIPTLDIQDSSSAVFAVLVILGVSIPFTLLIAVASIVAALNSR